MKNWKFAVTPLCLAAAMLLASTCYGQSFDLCRLLRSVQLFSVAGVRRPHYLELAGPLRCAPTAVAGTETITSGPRKPVRPFPRRL